MYRKLIFIFILTLTNILPVQAQFAAMFWNVENLFDTRHDSLKKDQDFLPQSTRNWNYTKFKKKISQIARTIAAAHGWDPPVLIGLCEVENEFTMNTLMRHHSLASLGYRYILTESDDPRGIDVALMYRRDRFKLLHWTSIQASTPEKPTRDILYACGRLIHGDTLDVFVAHFPSRRGGARNSEKHRIKVARKIKNFTDSIFRIRQQANILIMGDFNDQPDNRSVKEILCAVSPPPNPHPDSLYHMLANKANRTHTGTYKFQGEWNLLDHLIVSGSMLDQQSDFYTSESHASIIKLPFLLTQDEKFGGEKPFRTYNGMRYQGGYSDHLPVLIEFVGSKNTEPHK